MITLGVKTTAFSYNALGVPVGKTGARNRTTAFDRWQEKPRPAADNTGMVTQPAPAPTTEPGGRIPVLDGLRGVAVALVVP